MNDEISTKLREVLVHLAAGKTTAQIAAAMGISVHAVEQHSWKLARRLGVHGRANRRSNIVDAAERTGLLAEQSGFMKRLKTHPLCDIFPRMNTAEFTALKDDIEKRGGIVEPIWIKDGFLIDGRHRLRACRELGIALKDADFREFLGDDIEAFVVSMNSARRHLSPQARAAVARRLLRMHPERSDRTIATEAKVDHKTVASIRDGLQQRGEIPHVDNRRDSIGRSQPASKPKLGKHDFGAEHITTPADLVARRIISEFRRLRACEMTKPLEYLEWFDVERERFASECSHNPMSVNQ